MSVSVVVAGVSYTIPQVGETSWGPSVTSWIQAISAVTLQTSGGSFTLTSDLNFGNSFGLLSLYYKSVSANIAGSGVIRLANSDAIGWRNSGNSADLLLQPDADGILKYNGVDLVTISASQSLSNKQIVDPSDNTKALAFSLSGMTTGKTLTLASAQTTSQTLSFPNISGADTIATLGLSQKFLGAITFGSTFAQSGSGSGSITFQAQASAGTYNWNWPTTAGSSGQVLTSAGGGSSAMTWTSPLTNPMSAVGDLIYGGSSGTATRLAAGTAGQLLVTDSTGGAPSWQNLDLTGVNTLLSGALSVANGGTGKTSLTAYALLAAGTTSTGQLQQVSGLGTSGQFLQSQGASALPVWATPTAPSRTILTSVGTTVGYAFACSGITTAPTTGAVYTNNGNSYTVISATPDKSVVFVSGASAPTSSGTLTKSSGTGDSSITFSFNEAVGSFTPGSGVQIMKVTAIGGGGGGGGVASASGQSGAGGGGGGGGGGIVWISSPGGTTFYFTIAGGGPGGSAGNNAGGSAGFTGFASSSGAYAAYGGGGGQGGSTTSGFAFLTGTASGGGTTINWDIVSPGGIGGYAMANSTSGNISGAGGVSAFGIGFGPSPNVNSSGVGTNAGSYGAGGSGASSLNNGGTHAGGSGYQGILYLEFFTQ